MKIIYIIPAFYPAKEYGGAPQVAFEMATRLFKKGHDVTIFTTDAKDRSSRVNNTIDTIEGIIIYYFKNISNCLAYKHKLFLSPFMLFKLRKEYVPFP